MNLNSSSIDDRNTLLERRNSLINLSRTTLTNFNNINKYEISLEKQQYLENENKELSEQYGRLRYINQQLEKIYEERLYTDITDSGDFISVSQALKTKGDYITSNIKITTIEIDMDDDYIYTCNFYHSDGTTEKMILYNKTKPDNIETKKYNLSHDEFLHDLDYYYTDTNNKALIFKTSKNKTAQFIPKNMSLNASDYGRSKDYFLQIDFDTWENHYQKYNGVNDYYLASITTEADNELLRNYFKKVKQQYPQYPFNKVYLGGKRTTAGNDSSNKNDTSDLTWYWLDGSEWTDFNKNAFDKSRGQPNNLSNNQTVIAFNTNDKSFDGKWDDDPPTGKKPVLLSKTKNTRLGKAALQSPKDYQLVFFEPYYIKKYNVDKTAVDEAEKLLNTLYQYKSQIGDLEDYINTLINNNKEMMKMIAKEYRQNLRDIRKIIRLNNLEGFENKKQSIINKNSNILYDIYNNISTMFTTDHKLLIENMDNQDYTSPYYDKRKENVNKIMSSINEELHLTDKFEYDQNRNFLLELGSQNNNLFTNLFMDYMINNQTNSSIEDIYEKKNQEKSDTIRKININNFKYKTINEYSNIIKFTIVCSILMILFLLLNRFRLISKNLALAFIIALLITIVLFILYSSYNLYIKDKYNFDKIDFPFDPNNYTSEKNNDNTNNINMNLGCVAEECCGENMTFDVDDNKCKPNNYIYPGWLHWGTGYDRMPAKGNSIYECLQKVGSKYSVVGHRNDKHPNPGYRNTCYAWSNNPPENIKIRTMNGYYPNKYPLPEGANDNIHTMTCSNGNKIPDLCN